MTPVHSASFQHGNAEQRFIQARNEPGFHYPKSMPNLHCHALKQALMHACHFQNQRKHDVRNQKQNKKP
jgi:hypothetical protein